jgi:hypothetical protein
MPRKLASAVKGDTMWEPQDNTESDFTEEGYELHEVSDRSTNQYLVW